ncbi:MAG: carbon monoxide dehydrogenase subunit G [Anaerolineales bacterium]|nr:carbon monoxide dehydrogenase subunit G [Anaerolineales bacterium]
MKIEGEYTFDGPREVVWVLVRDPEVLATCLPGTQSLRLVGENEYEGEINVRIGPIAGVFSGRLIVSDEAPPESCTLTGEGKGKPGFVKGSGNVQLFEQADNKTLMKYDGEVQIGGRLASVGQRMIDTVSKSMIGQGLGVLNEAIKARVLARAEAKEVEYTPPSETEFAAAVAKDMAGGLLSSKLFLWLALAVIAVILVVIVWLSVG